MSNSAGTLKKTPNPYKRAGAAIDVGFTNFFIFAEGGYQCEKLDTMSYSGTLSNSVSSIDLSGTYVAAEFIVTGLPGFLTK